MLIAPHGMKKISIRDCIYLGDRFCFKPSEEIVSKCLEFAEGKAKSNAYLGRVRNADMTKIKLQDGYSKLSEFLTLEFLQKMGLNVPYEVDCSIYGAHNKSWEADIGKNIGVKSTSLVMSNYIARNKRGSRESWSFQYKNKKNEGGTDTGVFGLSEKEQKKKWFVFATVEHEEITTETRVWIRGFMQLHHITKFLKDPIKEEHKGRTKVIYDGDLKAYQLRLDEAGNEMFPEEVIEEGNVEESFIWQNVAR